MGFKSYIHLNRSSSSSPVSCGMRPCSKFQFFFINPSLKSRYYFCSSSSSSQNREGRAAEAEQDKIWAPLTQFPGSGHTPSKYLNSSPPSSSATATVESTTIFRLGRWRRATTRYAKLAHRKIAPQIFGALESHHFASDSRNRGLEAEVFCNSKTKIGAKMCSTANGKIRNQSDASPRKDQIEKPSKLLTLPTILTIGRVVAVPFLVGTFYAESSWAPAATFGIFIAAAFTDWLDGYLARKMNLGTPFGAFLDPVADKLMVAATLILLCTRPLEAGVFGQAPWLLTVPAIAIIGREITMSAVREWAAAQDRKLLEAVAVNNLGKWKTATQMIALTILLATRDGSLVEAGTLAYSGVVLLYISAWLALWSLVVYTRKIGNVLLRL